jgi:hypothetical protein
MLMRVSIPVETGNAAAKAGTLGSTVEKILADLKPEAVYFFTDDNGNRSGSVVFDLKETSQIPGISEPWFLAFNATVSFRPVRRCCRAKLAALFEYRVEHRAGTRNSADAGLLGRKHFAAEALHQVFERVHASLVNFGNNYSGTSANFAGDIAGKFGEITLNAEIGGIADQRSARSHYRHG